MSEVKPIIHDCHDNPFAMNPLSPHARHIHIVFLDMVNLKTQR